MNDCFLGELDNVCFSASRKERYQCLSGFISRGTQPAREGIDAKNCRSDQQMRSRLGLRSSESFTFPFLFISYMSKASRSFSRTSPKSIMFIEGKKIAIETNRAKWCSRQSETRRNQYNHYHQHLIKDEKKMANRFVLVLLTEGLENLTTKLFRFAFRIEFLQGQTIRTDGIAEAFELPGRRLRTSSCRAFH